MGAEAMRVPKRERNTMLNLGKVQKLVSSTDTLAAGCGAVGSDGVRETEPLALIRVTLHSRVPCECTTASTASLHRSFW
jgi:hypothetical protein